MNSEFKQNAVKILFLGVFVIAGLKLFSIDWS